MMYTPRTPRPQAILSAKDVPYVVAAPLLIQDMDSWARDGVAGGWHVYLPVGVGRGGGYGPGEWPRRGVPVGQGGGNGVAGGVTCALGLGVGGVGAHRTWGGVVIDGRRLESGGSLASQRHKTRQDSSGYGGRGDAHAPAWVSKQDSHELSATPCISSSRLRRCCRIAHRQMRRQTINLMRTPCLFKPPQYVMLLVTAHAFLRPKPQAFRPCCFTLFPMLQLYRFHTYVRAAPHLPQACSPWCCTPGTGRRH